ncbi:zinc finger protein mnm-2-like [Tetranychus urticae]|uniref:C2H2-type domain-containing protein n=1 Tax=Tetranychus urticae TaxID=32264 RepID=T1KIW3_TETUR|nr:zinc finger protein mnm-2-like [Tetranychus urticae]
MSSVFKSSHLENLYLLAEVSVRRLAEERELAKCDPSSVFYVPQKSTSSSYHQCNSSDHLMDFSFSPYKSESDDDQYQSAPLNLKISAEPMQEDVVQEPEPEPELDSESESEPEPERPVTITDLESESESESESERPLTITDEMYEQAVATARNDGYDEGRASFAPDLESLAKKLKIPLRVFRSIEFVNGGHGIKNPILSHGKLKPAIQPSLDDPLKCPVCSQRFAKPRCLKRHLKNHSDVKEYLCTFCGKGFNDTFDLKKHTRTHTGVRPYKCDHCEKSFAQRCSLESHTFKIHGISHSYAYRERRTKLYVCEACGNTTNKPETHYLHLKNNHPDSPALAKVNDRRFFKFDDPDFPFAE